MSPPTASATQLAPVNQASRFPINPFQRKGPPGSTFLRIARRVSGEFHVVRSYLLFLRFKFRYPGARRSAKYPPRAGISPLRFDDRSAPSPSRLGGMSRVSVLCQSMRQLSSAIRREKDKLLSRADLTVSAVDSN